MIMLCFLFRRPGNHVCKLESTMPRFGGARQRMVLHLLPFVQVPGLGFGDDHPFGNKNGSWWFLYYLVPLFQQPAMANVHLLPFSIGPLTFVDKAGRDVFCFPGMRKSVSVLASVEQLRCALHFLDEVCPGICRPQCCECGICVTWSIWTSQKSIEKTAAKPEHLKANKSRYQIRSLGATPSWHHLQCFRYYHLKSFSHAQKIMNSNWVDECVCIFGQDRSRE